MKSLTLREALFLLLALAVTLIFIRLGIWQLDRHQSRTSRNEAIRRQLAQPPLDLNQADIEGIDPQYRRVEVSGQFDSDRQILLKNRARGGQNGFILVTPLTFPRGNQAVLVYRGWIPAANGNVPDLQPYLVEGEVQVEGIAMPSQEEPSLALLADPTPESPEHPLQLWRVLNIEGISRQIPYPILDYYILSSQPVDRSDPAPLPEPEIDLETGPHLGYAIQWFAFALIAKVGSAIWLRRRGERG